MHGVTGQTLTVAVEMTTAMAVAADAGDWEAVAALAAQRQACLEVALAGDAWFVEPAAVQAIHDLLAADQILAARAVVARQDIAAALCDLHDGARMHNAYAAVA